MFLAKLTIYGFKSFAKKTELSFSPGLSAVVGPNGCGKTNILDAIRWVIGEQKVKSLRSNTMQDVIFKGTREQKPMSMAEVQLKLKDCKGLLPYDPMEDTVVIGRRFFRSGDSEYLVNGRQVRLKDIQSILMGTGIGSSVYALIEQSMIQRILSGRKDDRRALFEEAAGIMKYKLDRRASEFKLKSTEDDLARLGDIISEVDKNVAFLKRQMRRAQDLKRLKDRASGLAVRIAFNEYGRIRASLTAAAKELSQKEEETALVHAKKTELETRRQTSSVDRDEKEAKSSKLAEALRKIESQIASAEKEHAVLEERILNAQSGITTSKVVAETQSARAKDLTAQLDNASKSLETKKAELEGLKVNADEVADRLSQAERDLAALRKEVAENRRKLTDSETAAVRASANIDSTRSNIEMLSAQIEELSNRRTEAMAGLEAKQTAFALSAKDLESRQRKTAEAKATFDNSERTLESVRTEKTEASDKIGVLSAQIAGLRAKLGALQDALERGELDKSVRQRLAEQGGALGKIAEFFDTNNIPAPAIDLVLADLSRAWLVPNATSAEICARILSEAKASATLVVLDELPNSAEDTSKRLLALLEGFNTDESSEKFVSKEGDYLRSPGIRKIGKPAASPVTRSSELKSLRGEIAELEKAEKSARERYTAILAKETESKQALDNARIALVETEKAFREAEKAHREAEFEIRSLEGALENFAANAEALEAQRQSAIASLDELKNASAELEKTLISHREKLNLSLEAQERAEALVRERSKEATSRQMEFIRQRGEIENIERDFSRMELQRKEALDELARAEKRAVELQAELEASRADQAGFGDRIQELFIQKNSAEKELHEAMQDALEAGEALRKLDGAIREAANSHAALEKIVLEKSLLKHDLELQGGWIKKNLQNEFSVDIDEVEGEEGLSDLEEQRAKDQLDKLKQRIAEFGGVDPESEVKFNEEQARLEFMTSQREDLLEASRELKKTIRKLDNLAREEFMQTFEKTRLNFRQLFTELFEGGEADLKLEEGVDILEADIEIAARPRGKRFLSIDQLSAGEKALCALSLLFGLYKVKPSPFCMLDEVDAPLDDANVNRFLRLIRRFSDETQFILITHNKRTMEATDYLYGITMQERGVSKAISLKLADLALDFDGRVETP